jgi:preprotein translocase SecE subunit
MLPQGNPIKKSIYFFQEVRHEMRCVTWASKREVLLTTLFVFIFTVAASLYFVVVDHLLFKGLTLITS